MNGMHVGNRQRRRKIVLRIRAEGAKAFQDGRTVQACPREYMGTMNKYQWERGYDEARRDADERR